MTPATKPGQRYYYEWIAPPIQSGEKAFIFLAVDEYSQLVFDLGIENHITDIMISNKVMDLVYHPDFKNNGSFELIIGGSEYAHNEINKIIKPEGGTLIHDEAKLDHFLMPILKQMFSKWQQ